MQTKYDVIIIGAGVVGCALARYLTRFKLSVAVFEKEADVCDGISRANSGVLHAGFNVPPGSLKAKLNVAGVGLFFQIAEELGLEYSVCGKVVTAKNAKEHETLLKLFDWGTKNGCIGLSLISGEEAEKLQPGIISTSALYSEKTAVFSPYKYTIALAESARQNGAVFHTETGIKEIKEENAGPVVITENNDKFSSRWIINAAGLGASHLAKQIDPVSPTVYPFRGQYQILDKAAASYLQMAVYPVPPADGKGLGIHITPTPEGNILIGPSAEFIDSETQTNTTREVQQVLTQEARELLPALKNELPIRVYAGIRPKLSPPNIGEFKDYYIKESITVPNVIHLLGIESPGLTAAPAIARYIVDTFITPKETLLENPDFNPRLYNNPAEGIKSPEEIVCRCEEVTKQEIANSYLRLFGPVSVQALKKRCRITGGRCQGGYCLVRLVPFLQEEFGVNPTSLVLRSKTSPLFFQNETHSDNA